MGEKGWEQLCSAGCPFCFPTQWANAIDSRDGYRVSTASAVGPGALRQLRPAPSRVRAIVSAGAPADGRARRETRALQRARLAAQLSTWVGEISLPLAEGKEMISYFFPLAANRII